MMTRLVHRAEARPCVGMLLKARWEMWETIVVFSCPSLGSVWCTDETQRVDFGGVTLLPLDALQSSGLVSDCST